LKFTSLALSNAILDGIKASGFTTATPIQEQSLPLTLEGKDVVGLARTGSGKTAAFLLPILQKIETDPKKGIQGLIISPTRELASQIDDEIFALGYHAGATSALIIGGSDFSAQSKAIRNDVSILVATPGRLIDQIKLMKIDFSNLDFLVLDEADRMLDMGFMPDIKKIIGYLPEKRQTLLFSATMPSEIKKLVADFMNDPEFVEVEASKPAESVQQYYYNIKDQEKTDLLENILEKEQWESVIVFTARKSGADKLAARLNKRSIMATSIHGDLDQDEREKALHAFSFGDKKVIVATDVLARGIDIKDVKAIINYDVPRTSDDYIHRIGRTGRYDKEGVAITFVCPRDKSNFHSIVNELDNKIVQQNADSLFQTEQTSASKKPTKQPVSEPEPKAKPKSHSQSRSKSEPQKVENKTGSDQQSPRRASADIQETQEPNQYEDEEDLQVDEEFIDKHYNELVDETAGVPKISKAAERKSRRLRPAKGYWGIVKSLLPKF